jgi:acetyl/propionyl-CoA carboxylase alpha subunit
MQRALHEFTCTGIKTNAEFIRGILADPEYVRNALHTRWVDDRLAAKELQANRTADEIANPRDGEQHDVPTAADAAGIAVALWQYEHGGASRTVVGPAPSSRWKHEGRRELRSRDPREN